ncbi:MAG: nucleotidyltransferase domain-containing protein [Deltaproteobacteria bacterium]|nr:nucleotidyltransferase domain-containing protein [Deltaproteobacteria bacterium]MBW2014756.1 nucleotidyltransferase domain-containing protein [Deltaproteobacteria bacterium]MBW2090099.1 nucleotidyltransferase domain-containing protein [Deltaproteobacteria bacterium]
MKNNVLERPPDLIRVVKEHSDVVVLYSFGSVAKKELKPLSDLDFAIVMQNIFQNSQ